MPHDPSTRQTTHDAQRQPTEASGSPAQKRRPTRRVLASFCLSLFLLVIPPSYLAALVTAFLIHVLGIVSLHHWQAWQWLLLPARFALFCYPLVVLAAILLGAALASGEGTPATLAAFAAALGFLAGVVIAWFPNPVVIPLSKPPRLVYTAGLSALFAAWSFSATLFTQRLRGAA